jgi:tRNA A-37 threonylcarbamoyl transferase component Bud32
MQTASRAVILGVPAAFGAEDGPFSLPLADGTNLVCERVVRRVPGARLVCSGRWQGRAVYAKIFIGPHAGRHAARDRRGVCWLQERGIATPALLHETQFPDGSGRVLLFAAIENSGNAEEYLASLAGDAQARLRLMETLVQVVARHHEAGVHQTDLYLKNFLIQGERIYTLDGDGIRAGRGPLGPRRSLRNLAQLLSKFDVEDEVHLPRLLQVYAEVRGWRPDALRLRRLAEAVWQHRYEVAQEYAMRKVLRTCTDVQVEKRWDRFLAVARAEDGPELRALIERPDDWLERPVCRRLKSGNTCTIGVLAAGARRVVIKRYNVKNFWHGVKIALRRSRAVRSWCNAHLLRMYGIATARPLAVLERRCGPLRRQAYFLAEWVDGPTAAEFFADPSVSEERRRHIAERLAELLHKLYLLGIEHGDLKADNLKIVGQQVGVLDLDALRQYRHARGAWYRMRHARDLRRFLQNWQDAPPVRVLLESALRRVYGPDPVLRQAGISILDEKASVS